VAFTADPAPAVDFGVHRTLPASRLLYTKRSEKP
jgi:hypothetical protein